MAAGLAVISKTGIELKSNSTVFASMQQRRAGVHIEAVVPDYANSWFTVYLNKAVPTNTKIAWFVLG